MVKTNRASAMAAVAGVMALTGLGRAGISQLTVTPPGGFVQAGSYSRTPGGAVLPGSDLAAWFVPPSAVMMDFEEQGFTGLGPATASASGSTSAPGGPIINSATGRAGMGFAQFAAGSTSPDETWFAMGIASGGWTESFRVDHPSLAGQPGFLVFRLRARGVMHTTALTGSTALEITGYKDQVELLHNPLFDRGASDPDDTGHQRVWWRLASYGLSDDRAVNDVVAMSVPITFGQPFTLGVYAMGFTGQRSSGGVGGSSSASLDFLSEGVTWDGIAAVYAGGAPISGYTVVAGSGIDWSGPYSPCRADLGGDGIVDFTDYLEFLNRFEAQDLSVDFTGDGLVDFADYLEFLNLYEAGC